MTNDTNTSSTWEVLPAGREETLREGVLGHEQVSSFMVYRLIPPRAESLASKDFVTLDGTLTCACGYEIPLKATIYFEGWLRAPSKHPETCPQCWRSIELSGHTTGAGGSEKQWLLVRPTTGKPGVVEMPGTPSGMPEISIDSVERIIDEREGIKKWEGAVGAAPESEEKLTTTRQQSKTVDDKTERIAADRTKPSKKHMTLAGIWNFSGAPISPDSSFILSASGRSLKIWDAATGKERATLEGHSKAISCCAISPDSSFLVSGSVDKTLKIWDAATWKERVTLTGHTDRISDCAISPDASFVVSASNDCTLSIWDVATGKKRGSFWEGLTGKRHGTLVAHRATVGVCAISPDSSYIVSGSTDGAVKIWDASTGKKRVNLVGHTGWISNCAISSDSSFILTASWDGTLRIWDAATGHEQKTLIGHTKAVNDCAISPDSSFIVSSSSDNTLKIWDRTTGEERATLIGHTDVVRSCAISPDSTFIVSSSKDKTLKIWDVAAGKELATLIGHSEDVLGCAISPNGSFILSSGGKALKIWDIDSEISKSRETVSAQPVEKDSQPTEETAEIGQDDRLPSEVIWELFERRRLDPNGKKILAFAMLYEREMAPAVWVGPGPDPFAVEGESKQTRMLRFLASKIVPGYQPHFIPRHLRIDKETAVTGRKFELGEDPTIGNFNQVLAVMLADLIEDQGLLDDQELRDCSALALSGNSPALGEGRFALLVI